jgi:nicotinate-nucleotide pyrophosphorylase
MTAHPPALVERVAEAIDDALEEDGSYENIATAALDASGHAEMIAALARAQAELAGERDARDKLERAYREKDAAVSALMSVCTEEQIALAKGRASEPTR